MGRRGEKQLRRRVDCRLDVAKALELRVDRGLTYAQIGKILGVTKQRVHRALQPFVAMLENPGAIAAYQRQEAKLLDAVRMLLVRHMADPGRLEKASVNNLAFAFSQVFNASRLLRGDSTANVGVRAALVLEAHRRDVPEQGRHAAEQEQVSSTRRG